MSLIGHSVKRLEDRPLLTGSGRFVADNTPPDALYLRVVRSPIAFGRLTSIRVAEALAHPGTVAVWTTQDVANIPQSAFACLPHRDWNLIASRSWLTDMYAMSANP